MRTRLSVAVRLEGRDIPVPDVTVRFFREGRPRTRLGTARTDRSGVASVIVDVPLPVVPTPAPPRDLARGYAAEAVTPDGTVLGRSVLRPARGALHAVIPVTFAVALTAGIIAHKPRPTAPEKRAAWIARWQEGFQKRPDDRVEDDLCLTRAVLDLMASAGTPTTKLQERYTEALAGRLGDTALVAVREAAQAGRDLIDDSGLLTEPCSVATPEDVATILLRKGAVDDLVTTLKSRAAPPADTVGPVLKGTPFFDGEVELTKDCAERRAQGLLDGDVADALGDLTADPPRLLAPAVVNYVRVYDHATGQYVREGDLHAKRLEVRELDAAELWLTADLDLDVELDSEDCLVLEPDPDEPARQAMLVDVVPGQTVLLMGAGFLGERARVELRHRRWEDLPDEGRLAPRAPSVTVDLAESELEIHGSGADAPPGVEPEDFADDQIDFTWPAEAQEPGLYELTLTFPNDAGYVTGWSQDPTTCEITQEHEDPSVRLLFAVLPPRQARRITATATRVDCIDETDPEPWPFFDDVQYTAQGAVLRVVLDLDDPEATSFEEVLQTIRDGRQFFGSDGEQWFPDFQLVPESGTGGRVLGLDEFLSFTLSLDEVEGDLDREILRWILIAAMIAVIVLIIAAAIVLAIVVVVVVAALTAELGATPAVAAAGMAFGLVTALAALLITIAETVGLSSIDTIVSALPWGARILRVSPTVSGLELASRLSPFRFHRVLHLADRPDAAALQPIVQVSELDDDGLRERYRGDALGGRYRVWLDVAT